MKTLFVSCLIISMVGCNNDTTPTASASPATIFGYKTVDKWIEDYNNDESADEQAFTVYDFSLKIYPVHARRQKDAAPLLIKAIQNNSPKVREEAKRGFWTIHFEYRQEIVNQLKELLNSQDIATNVKSDIQDVIQSCESNHWTKDQEWCDELDAEYKRGKWKVTSDFNPTCPNCGQRNVHVKTRGATESAVWIIYCADCQYEIRQSIIDK